MKIGYARVSIADQHLRMQKDALKQTGSQRIYHDIASGAKTDRPRLEKAIEQLREGDVLVVIEEKLRHLSFYHITQMPSNLIDVLQIRAFDHHPD